ncbi:hypothetical protein [Nocardia alni]|uniref:hypothetical protein n=1 Tax=Nocardia alni TaxID=2815723 RepID=UPI001C223540|nr:hypothetical protein [Nocardia alni]
MVTNFDPRSWRPGSRALGLGRRLLDLDQWSSFTTAWLDPVADLGSGTVTALVPDVLMTLLSGGILSRFGGQEVTAAILGHEMRGALRTLTARRRGANFEVEAVLEELHWDRYPIDELTVVAHGVRLIPGVPTKVRASMIDITGTVSTAALLDWLNTWEFDWELGADPSGLLVGRHRRQRTRALIDASVIDDLLTIVVHRVSRCGVRIPRRWARVAPIPLTDLPKDIRVRSTRREGDRVRFQLEIPELTASFDLAQIRSAIVAGTTLVIF